MDKCGIAWFKMDEESGNIIDSKNGYIGTPYNLTYQGKEGIYFNEIIVIFSLAIKLSQ